MTIEPETTQLEVPAEAAGERLDSWLAEQLATARNRVRRWIDDGLIEVVPAGAGARPKPSLRLSGGEKILIQPPSDTLKKELDPENAPLAILHEATDFVVLDKPAGLVVHPGAGHPTGTLCHRLIHHYPECRSVGHPQRPGIVHRLDRGTSGVMVVARTDRGYQHLTAMFAARAVEKHYVAFCFYGRAAEEGVIDLPIARHRHDRTRMAVDPAGRPAHSSYRVLARSGTGRQAVQIAALLVRIATGRTHQVRVHLQADRAPLVGDEVYGESRWKNVRDPRIRQLLSSFPRPALHAWRLAFTAPGEHELIPFQSPLAGDMTQLWDELEGQTLSGQLLDGAVEELRSVVEPDDPEQP